jgi:methylmalonyl-CoA mutase cobalamin-binding subunit
MAAAEPAVLSIGALSAATGIPVPTLRTWERRYDVPTPLRKPSGHRLYPASAVEHLRKVSRLLERGHRAGDVLAFPAAELDALLALPGSVAAARVPPAEGTTTPVDEMLAAVRAFDREALLSHLRSGWVRLGPLPFLRDWAGRLMTAVGDGWHAGTLEIRHEHFATACLAGFLREVREPFDRQARGRLVVAATLPGDLHEGGLLMASVVLALRGRRVVYLGTALPVPQFADAATGADVEAVAVSVSAGAHGTASRRALATLRAALPRRVALWVGGAGAPAPATGIERFDDLEALDARLERGA